MRSSQQQPAGEVPPAGREDAARVPGGGADARPEALAEPGLRAGRTPLRRRLAGLAPGQLTHRFPRRARPGYQSQTRRIRRGVEGPVSSWVVQDLRVWFHRETDGRRPRAELLQRPSPLWTGTWRSTSVPTSSPPGSKSTLCSRRKVARTARRCSRPGRLTTTARKHALIWRNI